MRRFHPLIAGVLLLLPFLASNAFAADCVTSPRVLDEISRMQLELGEVMKTVKNECKDGTVGRAQQAYYEFLGINVDTDEILDSVRSLVDTGQNHALAHDILVYEEALENIDRGAKQALDLCSSAVGTSLAALKARYVNGDPDTEQNPVQGLKRLKNVYKEKKENNNDWFYFEQSSGRGKSVSYYDRESPFACTLPQYGFAEFKRIFTSFLDTLKNFRKMAQDIQPREGPVLYQEFLTDQELMSVKDFKEILKQDTRENQIVDGPSRAFEQGRIADTVRNKDDRPTTLGGMLSQMVREKFARVGTEDVLRRTEARNVAYRDLTVFSEEDSELVQRINRQSGTHFLLYEALLNETDQILKVDLCRYTYEAANFMVTACNRTSYCSGQVCDESEPMRNCSP